MPSILVELLADRGVITQESNILEIGSGSGRYTIPLVRKAGSIIATDISSKMLFYLKDYAEEENADTIKIQKIDWLNTDVESVGLDNDYDLVLAVMSPGIRSKEALYRMGEISKGYCLVGQYVSWVDPPLVRIKQDLNFPKGHFDPHDDRDTALRSPILIMKWK